MFFLSKDKYLSKLSKAASWKVNILFCLIDFPLSKLKGETPWYKLFISFSECLYPWPLIVLKWTNTDLFDCLALVNAIQISFILWPSTSPM